MIVDNNTNSNFDVGYEERIIIWENQTRIFLIDLQYLD
jgi:hypothetical protein